MGYRCGFPAHMRRPVGAAGVGHICDHSNRSCPRCAWALAAAGAVTVLICGCSLVGDWQTVSVRPAGEHFPITNLTLDKQHGFTATYDYDGQRRTCAGRYEWSGMRLVLEPVDGQRRVYRARRRINGRLVLVHEDTMSRVVATLERTGVD